MYRTVGKHLVTCLLYMQTAALKTPRKTLQTWPGQVDKNFQGSQDNINNIFNTLNMYYFYSGIQNFAGTIFLDIIIIIIIDSDFNLANQTNLAYAIIEPFNLQACMGFYSTEIRQYNCNQQIANVQLAINST